MTRKDLAGAKKRSLITEEHIPPRRPKLTCLTCGRQFLSPNSPLRLFGCGCCAYAHHRVAKNKLNVRKGDRVVLVRTVRVGTIEGFEKDDQGVLGVLRFGENDDCLVRVGEIEKVLTEEVNHASKCVHGTRFPRKEETDDYEGDDSNLERQGAEGGADV